MYTVVTGVCSLSWNGRLMFTQFIVSIGQWNYIYR